MLHPRITYSPKSIHILQQYACIFIIRLLVRSMFSQGAKPAIGCETAFGSSISPSFLHQNDTRTCQTRGKLAKNHILRLCWDRPKAKNKTSLKIKPTTKLEENNLENRRKNCSKLKTGKRAKNRKYAS